MPDALWIPSYIVALSPQMRRKRKSKGSGPGSVRPLQITIRAEPPPWENKKAENWGKKAGKMIDCGLSISLTSHKPVDLIQNANKYNNSI